MNALDVPLSEIFNKAWTIFNQFLSWIVLIIGALTGLWMYNEFKPKPRGRGSPEIFIDDELRKLLERREVPISWGPIFLLNKLKLLYGSPDTTIHLNCRAAGRREVALPEDCKKEKVSGGKKWVYLRGRRYFKRMNIDVITAMLETPLENDYRERVHCLVQRIGQTSELVITNENAEEVRKYQLSLSKEIHPLSLDKTGNHIESVKVEIPFSQFGGLVSNNLGQLHTLGLPIIMEIRSIPGMGHGNEPGKITIPICPEVTPQLAPS